MTSQAFNYTKLYKAISTVQTLGIGISSWLSFSGIKKILPPSEGLTNDITAGLISVGMFCSMYTLLQSQKLMVELGTKSTTALATHLAAIVLMLGLSPPTNFIAQVADPAAIRDMQQAQKVAEEMGMEAKEISDMLGSYTVKAESLGADKTSPWSSLKDSVSETGRPLMMPDEILRMASDEQIILIKDLPPIRCKRLPYHHVPTMHALLEPNPLEGGLIPLDPKVSISYEEICP